MGPQTHLNTTATHEDDRLRLGIDSRLLDAEGHPAHGTVVRRLIALIGPRGDLVPVTTDMEPDGPDAGGVLEQLKVLEDEGIDGFVHETEAEAFVLALNERLPLVPTAADDRLGDPRVWESFITNLFCLRRWRQTLARRRTAGGLVDYHSRHKLLILAHDEAVYRRMGRLVANSERHPVDRLFADYQALLLRALATSATPGRHVNVLQHILGYFKQAPADERGRARDLIDAYGHGSAPLAAPRALLSSFAAAYEQEYLERQFYVNPEPLELELLDRVEPE